jgi:phosphoenolpyruvate carboxykinase (GTP)
MTEPSRLGTSTAVPTTNKHLVRWVESLNFSGVEFEELERVDRSAWRQEVMGHEELFIALHDHLPPEMIYERELLICRL